MTTKRISAIIIIGLGLLFSVLATPALAQGELTLNVHRNFGYGNGSQIRGSFSMAVTGPQDLRSVAFKIDGAVMQEVSAPPFKINFNTGGYPVGWHELSATAVTADGRTLESNVRRFQFVSVDEEKSGTFRIVLPVLGVVFGFIAIMAVFQFVQFRRKHETVPLGAHRTYGISGGAICPRCGRPFPLHWYAINAGLLTKLDTCEHCGRWGLFRRRSAEDLARAEVAELKDAQPDAPIHEVSPEEKLKQQLDSSRFDDMK